MSKEIDKRLKAVDWDKLTRPAGAEEVIREIFVGDEESLPLRTDLTPRQIRALTLLLYLYKKYAADGCREVAVTFMRLRVSKGRQGRREFVEALRSRFTQGGSPLEKLLRR